MGDVAALPQANDLARLVGPLKPAKILREDVEPPAATAETPCHGRKASRDGCVPAEQGGGVVLDKLWSFGEQQQEAGAGGANCPVKGVQTAASRLRSPSTESDTPNPRTTAAGVKSGKVVVVSTASPVSDTETHGQQQQQQEQQQQRSAVFERMDIRRVGSTAESVVDVWAPSLARAGSKVFDTAVTDSQSTLRLSLTRPASKRASLSRFSQLFASAATTVAEGDHDNIQHQDAGAAGAAAGTADAAADAAESDTTGDDSEFDTANPLFEAAADGAETLQVGRPTSRRGAIPIFATAEGLGYGAGSASEDGQSLSGAGAGMEVAMAGARVFDSRNPMYGVPAPDGSGDGEGDSGGGGGGRGGATASNRRPALKVDCSRPISLDDLRDLSSTGSSERAGDEERGVSVVVDGGNGPALAGSSEKAAAAAVESSAETGSGDNQDDVRGDSMVGSEDSFATDDTAIGKSVAAASAVSADTAPDDAPTTPDNRISPFDPDNATLWATAATAAAAAAAAADLTAATTNHPSSFPLPRRPRSGSDESSATTATAATAATMTTTDQLPGIVKRLRRAASGVGLLHISASSRVFPSTGRERRLARASSMPSTEMLPPAPHSSSALAGGGPQNGGSGDVGGLALHKLDGLGGVGVRGSWQQPGKDGVVAKLDKLEAGGDGSRAPAFGGDEFLGTTPLMSPLGSSSAASTANESSSMAAGAEAESLSPRSASLARARLEAEGDIEEGGSSAASTAAASWTGSPAVEVEVAARVAGVAAADVGAALAAAVATPEQVEVLPCAPSDDEKIIYRNTGRFGLVTCALLSFVTLTWGMWLFTIVMPAFYWFGGPAIFIIFYTACHYLGVAVWGKDFRLKEHARVVQRSEEKGYRPTVDVFLPVCKEPLHLLANTWRHVAALDYPDVNVFVLDDGKSDEVKALAASFGFEYVLRADAPHLKKAGNLRNAFERTSGDAIAIFDADFCPRPDFLKETVPYLGEDPSVGIVQTPQFFRHREEQTWIEQGAGVSQEFFYRMVQMNQDRFNAAVCVGSCGLYRRAALEPLGGMAAIEHSEDMYTGYKMTEHGFKIKYVPLALAMGICPDEPQSFFMQQYRWCKGSATLIREREFWQSNISRIHKLCFLNGMLYYMATALLIFLAPIPILLLVWVRADGVLWYHSGFVLPSIIFAGVIMPLWSTQRYGMSSHRVKVIQCYAHLYAIKDTFMGTHAPWVPSGANGARAKKTSGTYKSSIRLMVAWNVLITTLIVGGCVWRMTELTWYHFVPAMALAIGSFILNMSTLVY